MNRHGGVQTMAIYGPKGNRFLFVVAAMAAAVASGCATMNKGFAERVTVASDPPGAEVSVDGGPAGETPVTVSLGNPWWGQAGREAVIRLEKDCFRTSEIWLEPKISRWVWGNLVLAAISGVLAAAYSDGTHDWSPGKVAAGTLLWTVGVDLVGGAGFSLPSAVRPTLAPSKRPAGVDCTKLHSLGSH